MSLLGDLVSPHNHEKHIRLISSQSIKYTDEELDLTPPQPTALHEEGWVRCREQISMYAMYRRPFSEQQPRGGKVDHALER